MIFSFACQWNIISGDVIILLSLPVNITKTYPSVYADIAWFLSSGVGMEQYSVRIYSSHGWTTWICIVNCPQNLTLTQKGKNVQIRSPHSSNAIITFMTSGQCYFHHSLEVYISWSLSKDIFSLQFGSLHLFHTSATFKGHPQLTSVFRLLLLALLLHPWSTNDI